jgi:hypothetical protein
LEAAKSESKKTILVYASEKAMNWELKALPIPLEARSLLFLGLVTELTSI